MIVDLFKTRTRLELRRRRARWPLRRLDKAWRRRLKEILGNYDGNAPAD